MSAAQLDAASRKTLMTRIKKLLAMAGSTSPHEAEIALGRAKKLMEAHGITNLDVDAAEIETSLCKAQGKTKPTPWETMLAQQVAHFLACKLIYCQSRTNGKFNRAEWKFIGIGPSAEVATYTFNVLCRQLLKARQEYLIEIANHWMSKGRKTKLADAFCAGWVRSCTVAIKEFSGTPAQSQLLDLHVKNTVGDKTIGLRDRNTQGYDSLAYGAGCESGASARLHRGVGGTSGTGQLQIAG